MQITRRLFLTGASALICAPAIVRIESLMPIKQLVAPPPLWIPSAEDKVVFKSQLGLFDPDNHLSLSRQLYNAGVVTEKDLRARRQVEGYSVIDVSGQERILITSLT